MKMKKKNEVKDKPRFYHQKKKNGKIEMTFGRMRNSIGRMFGEFEFKHVKMEIPIIHAHGDVK